MNAVMNISIDLGSAQVTIAGVTVSGSATVSIPVDRADLLALLGGRDGVTLPVPGQAVTEVEVETLPAKRRSGYPSQRRTYSDDELRAAIEARVRSRLRQSS